MDLSRIAIEPRLRDGWEAIDMGISMTRAWWLPLQLSWLVPSSIVFFSLLTVFSEKTWIALLITWWLNPLWDRFPLLLASRALFDEPLRVRLVWAECLQLFKKDWLPWLTWRRFSPTRSLDMPVTVLEQLRGEARTRRLNILHRNSSGIAFLLTMLCIGFEGLILLALWMFVLIFVPEEVWVEEALTGFNNFFWFSRWSVVIWFVALSLVSPFFVVSGFALYINRRIELEGWDIEIRFRHLAERFSQTRPVAAATKKITAFLLPLFFGLGLTALPPSVQAQQDNSPIDVTVSDITGTSAAEASKQSIIEVLSGEDFKRTEIDKGWRFKQKQKVEGEESGWFLAALANLLDWISPFLSFIGKIFSVVPILIWLVLGLLIALAIYHFRDAIASIARRHDKPDGVDLPDVLFGLDLRKESLPDDIQDEVNRLWREGKAREAIGLLYRATLSALIHQFSFEFYDGYTEQECATVVRSKAEGKLSAYVQRLTTTWQHLAYAHRLPLETQMTELCSEWALYFSEAGRGER